MARSNVDQSCSFLSLIPAAIQTDILCNWLELEDISRFDSAACEVILRESYLQCVGSKYAVFRGYHNFIQTNERVCVEWLLLRGIRLSVFVVPAELSDNFELRQRYLTHGGQAIQSIDFVQFPDFDVDTNVEDQSEGSPLTRETAMREVADYCPNVTQINMFGQHADSALCPILQKCTKLNALLMPNCVGLNHEVISAICNSAHELTTLHCSTCTFDSDCFPVSGTSCSSLRSLVAVDNNLTSAQLVMFASLFPNVTDLTIGPLRCADLIKIAKACPHAMCCTATLIDQLSDSNAEALAIAWQHIEYLSLAANNAQTVTLASESSALHILERCTKLTYLELRGYMKAPFYNEGEYQAPLSRPGVKSSQVRAVILDFVSPFALAFLVEHCPMLEVLGSLHADLDATGQPCVFPADVLNKTRIKTLLLGDSRVLSGELSAEALNGVVELRVSSCEHATTTSLAALFHHCPNLQSLHIVNCAHVGVDALAEAVLVCRQLKHVQFRAPKDNIRGGFFSLKERNDSVANMLRRLCPRLETCVVEVISLLA